MLGWHEERLVKLEETASDTRADVAVLKEQVGNLEEKLEDGFRNLEEKVEKCWEPVVQSLADHVERDQREHAEMKEEMREAMQAVTQLAKKTKVRMTRNKKIKTAAVALALGGGGVVVEEGVKYFLHLLHWLGN